MDVYLKSAKVVDLKETAQIAQGLSAVVGTQLIRTENLVSGIVNHIRIKSQ